VLTWVGIGNGGAVASFGAMPSVYRQSRHSHQEISQIRDP
jgi:hypothetical protein